MDALEAVYAVLDDGYANEVSFFDAPGLVAVVVASDTPHPLGPSGAKSAACARPCEAPTAISNPPRSGGHTTNRPFKPASRLNFKR